MLDINNSIITDCKLITLPRIFSDTGSLTFAQNQEHIPFEIKRVYYLYDIPAGESRGGHVHKSLIQMVIAASGSFDIILKDGYNEKNIFLNQPDLGVLIPPGIWREIANFSSGGICLVLASELYHEGDYIRDYSDFTDFKQR